MSAAVALIPRGVEDDRRGTQGMKLFIFSEAMLFVMLFWAYFYLGHGVASWKAHPPALFYPVVMLGVLFSSSALLHWGQLQVDRGATRIARAAIFFTALLGGIFLILQRLEYKEQWKDLTPMTDAHGSMFYLLTSVHGAHVALGVCMLIFVFALPRIGKTDRPPYRPVHNVALYWHFVDMVWVLLVAGLYVLPHVRR